MKTGKNPSKLNFLKIFLVSLLILFPTLLISTPSHAQSKSEAMAKIKARQAIEATKRKNSADWYSPPNKTCEGDHELWYDFRITDRPAGNRGRLKLEGRLNINGGSQTFIDNIFTNKVGRRICQFKRRTFYWGGEVTTCRTYRNPSYCRKGEYVGMTHPNPRTIRFNQFSGGIIPWDTPVLNRFAQRPIQYEYYDSVCPTTETITSSDTTIDPVFGGSITFSGQIEDATDDTTWTISVGGKTFSGSGGSPSATWNGKDADNKMVGVGTHTATLTVKNSEGCSDSTTTTITISKESKDKNCKFEVTFLSLANIASGNLSHSQPLFNSKGLNLSLNYNSLSPYEGPLGLGWTHSYNTLLNKSDEDTYTLMEGNGRSTLLLRNGQNFLPSSGVYPYLEANDDGTYTLYRRNRITNSFNQLRQLTAITDRNGQSTTLAYDSNGNLATVTDSAGRSISLAYKDSAYITSITDPNGNIHTLSYMESTLAGTSSAIVGQPTPNWNYTYYPNAFMSDKTDPSGKTTHYTYNANHKVVSGTDSKGLTKTVNYPLPPAEGEAVAASLTTYVTQEDGGVWTYAYSTEQGTLSAKTDPLGQTTYYSYDADKNLIAQTEPDGTSTGYSYDAMGNISSMTDAMGNATSYSYNSYGDTTSINDSTGSTTSYGYDSSGNLTSMTDPAGGITTYQYNSRGNVTSVTNPAGQKTNYGYDSIGNLVSVTDPAGNSTTMAYDSKGNMTSRTDSTGAVTSYGYNSLNQLIKVTDPKGSITTFTYDINSNKTSQTDANGNTTYYTYDSDNNLVKVTDPVGNITGYTYGGTGCSSCRGSGGSNLTSLIDANRKTTTYNYDTLGRLLKESDPLGNVTSYGYNSKGDMTSKTFPNGYTINYRYDPLSRLKEKSYPDSTKDTFSYDAKGNILTAANQNISYTFSYDINNRLTSLTDSNAKTISYQYNISGNKTSMTTPEGKTISYNYDQANRLSGITEESQSFGLAYDSLGRRNSLTFPNGVKTNYSYDQSGRLTQLSTNSTNRIINSYKYTHDNVGNRLRKTEQHNKHKERKQTYQYDQIYRLLESTPSNSRGDDRDDDDDDDDGDEGKRINLEEQFSYDSVGNRLTGPENRDSYNYNTGNQLLSSRGEDFEYDANGNLIKSIGRRRDDDQRTTSTYKYDYENRLIEAIVKREDEQTTVTFKYDPFGRRIAKDVEVRDEGELESSKSYTYVYDNEDILLEYLTKRRGNGAEITRYLHGPGIDEPLAVEQGGDIYYYHADGLGSITALTDNRGKAAQTYSYDSFGNMKQNGNKIKQSYTYTGREYDRETGLYYYRARYYNATIGRFTTEDPIGFRGGINFYAYVGNNPVNISDPSGTMGIKPADPQKPRPNIPFFPPTPAPCDPYQWCSNAYNKKYAKCLLLPSSGLCFADARLWVENCIFWAGAVGDNSPNCKCE